MHNNKLGPKDQRHLEAAEGWLGLGCYIEANEELEQIKLLKRAHPSVLRVRCEMYAVAKNWEAAADIAESICKLLPDDSSGFIQRASALHEINRTREAMNVLLPVVKRFPDEYLISYNLACYFCQLGELHSAVEWLKKACEMGNAAKIKRMALDDPDLAPLWTAK